jgi:hypothetical protein
MNDSMRKSQNKKSTQHHNTEDHNKNKDQSFYEVHKITELLEWV